MFDDLTLECETKLFLSIVITYDPNGKYVQTNSYMLVFIDLIFTIFNLPSI